MIPSTYLDVIDYALYNYYKIATKLLASGELYIKVYTDRSTESVVTEFSENFKVRELCNTTSEPSCIENDTEPGIEFLMTFYGVSPNPAIILTSIDNKNEFNKK